MEPRVLIDVPKEQIKKPFLSHSVWQAYLECPAYFYFQYIMKVPESRSAALGIGTAWDEALSDFARRKMESKTPAAREMAEVFATHFDAEFSGVDWSDTELWDAKQRRALIEKHGCIPEELRLETAKKTQSFWRQWGIERVQAYVNEIGPTVRPRHVQRWFFIDFGDHVPFGYKGTIDRVDEDGTIIDNKTSKSRWSENDVRFDMQCVGYSLAYRLMEKKPERAIRYDVLVKTKTQTFKEQFQQIELGIETHRMNLLLAEISAAFQNIRSGNLFRRMHGYNGSCSYCAHQKICWEPHEQWAKAPTPEELKTWLAEDPANEARMEEWIEKVTRMPRLLDFAQVGRELAAAVARDPMILTFWY